MNIRLLNISSYQLGRMAPISIRKYHFSFQGKFISQYESRPDRNNKY